MPECAGCGRPLANETAECPACNAEGPGLIGDARGLAKSHAVCHLLLSPHHMAAFVVVAVIVVGVIVARFKDYVSAIGTAVLLVVLALAIAIGLVKLFASSAETRL
jgi:hypothetical protein